MIRTSKISVLVAAIAAFSLLFSGVAVSDTVKAGDVVTSGNVSKAAGTSGTARVWLLVNNDDDADKSGCNATASSPVTVALASSHANLSLASSSVTVTNCDDSKTDVVEGAATIGYSVASGAPAGAVYTISATGSGGKYAAKDSHYDAGSFTVTVSAPSDSTAPSITPNVSGTLGNNSWYRSDVALTWTVTDAESAVSSSTGCGATNITTDQNSTTYTCSATSAGGTASQSVSIKRDATAPVVQLSGGPSGDSYEGETPAAPTCSATDATSGLAAACTVSGYSTATGTHTATASATDKAGNTGSATGAAYTVLDDVSAPIITKTATGTQHTSGWFTSDVVLDWTVTEGETPSSLALTGCADKTINTDGTVTESCGATSLGGSASDSITIKRDATAPIVSLAGLANNASFYEGEGPAASAITCSASDVTSGLADADAATSGNQDCIISGYDGSTPGTRTLTATAYDAAGNVGTDTITYTVEDDTTPPTINATVTGTAGDNDWFTSNVGITWTVTENETPSSLSKTGCVDQTISTDGSVTLGCSATSAGGPASDSVTVNRDATVPTVAVTGLTDGASYYEGEVPAAECSANDATSLLADADTTTAGAQDCMLSAPTAQTPGEYQITASAKDNAGNTNSDVLAYTVLDDTSAPAITRTVTGTLGTNNWYTSNVTVDWSVTENDTPSSLASDCPQGSLTSDGTQTFTCSASSLGGGPVTESVTVKRDATAPTNVQFSSYSATQYFGFVAAAPTCTAADTTSGVKSCLVTGGGTGAGPQSWTATATDEAGNVKTATMSYTVSRWNTRGFFSPVDLNNTLNVVKAGSTVPLKFEVFAGVAPAGELTTTSAIGATIRYATVSCTNGTGTDDIEAVATGGTSLRYDDTAGQFVYNWKTPSAAGCYKVNVNLADGTTISALFKTR